MQELERTLPASLRSQVLKQIKAADSDRDAINPILVDHPPIELLEALHRQELSEPWRSEVLQHTLGCMVCRQGLATRVLGIGEAEVGLEELEESTPPVRKQRTLIQTLWSPDSALRQTLDRQTKRQQSAESAVSPSPLRRRLLGLALAAGLMGLLFGLGNFDYRSGRPLVRSGSPAGPDWVLKGSGSTVAPEGQALLLVGALPRGQGLHKRIQRLRNHSQIEASTALYFAFYLTGAGGYPYLFRVGPDPTPQLIFPLALEQTRRYAGGRVSLVAQAGLSLRYRLGKENGPIRFVLLQSPVPLSSTTLNQLLESRQGWDDLSILKQQQTPASKVFVDEFSLVVRSGGQP